MSFKITQNARNKAARNNKTPNLVFSIEGIDTLYGLIQIQKYIRIGDPDLYIGPDWVIGGLRDAQDQLACITFDGTSTSINQKLDPDKSSSASISTMQISLVDVDGSINDIISPGVVVDDILARKCTISLGFAGTAWPEDYIKIFRGVIDSIQTGPAKTTFNISHPDQKKRQDIFVKGEAKLSAPITNADTTIPVVSTSGFFQPILGPDATYDSSITYGIQIENEIIYYTSLDATNFYGCTRGQLGTTAISHAMDTDVTSFIDLTGNGIDLALKLMLSGWNGPWIENVVITNINYLADLTHIDNILFFDQINVFDVYGVTTGDWVTITGAINGANNVTRQITDVELVDGGSYITLDGSLLTDESASTAVCSFRSQYDTLADGLLLSPDEVDVAEHRRIQRLFLSSYALDFYLKDTINGKDFIEGEIYFPAAAYSIPRKSQVSIGYHIGPIPGTDISILTSDNTKKASAITINRSINKNFYNTIIYKYEELPLEEKFIRGYITEDATSLTDIPIGTRALIIKSKGMRETLSGLNIAAQGASRRLKRYKRGAEFIDSFEALYGESYNVEIGDIVVVEGPELKMVNTSNATRDGQPKLYEIVNKTIDIKTGAVKLSLINTNYSANTRYCLMSMASRIESATSSTVFKIRKTGNSVFGNQEGQKWSRFSDVIVRVRSNDFTTRNATSTIQSVLGNTITLTTSLGFTPQPEDTMTLSVYDDATQTLNLIYGYMNNNPTFADGKNQYEMIG